MATSTGTWIVLFCLNDIGIFVNDIGLFILISLYIRSADLSIGSCDSF